MAIIEQLLCGRSPENPDNINTVLSHSPGMGAAVTEEIVRFTTGWGDAPVGGLMRPAVLSIPLKSTMPSVRGQLYAVIRVTTGVPPIFHAVVMSRVDFRQFEYNPFAVVMAGSFLDAWSGRERLAQGRIEPPDMTSLICPPPSPADVGVVDEALLLFLNQGTLILKLEAGSEESDRVLGSVIQVMPYNLREKLRFASFSTVKDNSYTLAAAYAPQTPFSSWGRLFATMIDKGTSEPVKRYVASVRIGLASGNLREINTADTLGGGLGSTASPQAVLPEEPFASGNTVLAQEFARPQQTAQSTKTFPGSRRTAAAMIPLTSYAVRTGPGMGVASDPVISSGQGGAGASRSRLVRQSVPMGRRGRRRKSRALLTLTIIISLLAGGWVYLDRSGKGKQWGIFDFANRGSLHVRGSKAPSLLEVVDVGKEYSRQLGKIQRAKLVPGSDREQVVRRSQADLQAHAAGPLLVQADLYLQLADEGIQQGHRPDREKDRLNFLDSQGPILIEELGRLELAFFSLRHGVLWQDLEALPMADIVARRDSLMRAAKRPLALVSQELGTDFYWKPLREARKNVSGMAGLLSLFQAANWSKDWEVGMKRAAEKVSPTASPMSRAYRNNAFTLVRLKVAERQVGNLAEAYGRQFAKNSWPSSAVKGLLKELRRKASLFTQEEMPSLLAGILTLYARLEDPVPLAREAAVSGQTLADIRQNLAVIFDPAVYDNYLARVEFEAVSYLLQRGTDPSDFPDHLVQGQDLPTAILFYETLRQNENTADWGGLSARAGDTFLGRWSGWQGKVVHSRRVRMQESLDQSWLECQVLTSELRHRAAAGQDWTGVWVDLQGEIDKILANSPAIIQGDPVRSAKWNQAAELKASLEESRPLEVNSVVIRLEPEVMTGSGSVVVELQVDNDGRIFKSGPVQMGPAAPEGSGWVGTAEISWLIEVSPVDSFSARVLVPRTGASLLTVNYPSLRDRVGPGAMGRPRRAEGGALTFGSSKQWWRGLQLTTIP